VSSGGQAAFDYIDECLHRGESAQRVLRLAALASVTAGGLKPAVLKQLRRDLVNTFGIQILFTLQNLEQAGLLKKLV
jgi:hypothetical protein